ncbi:hypothetical protein D9M71_506450 [compost metagenome]
MIGEALLAVEDFGDRDFQVRQHGVEGAGIQLGAEQEARRHRQIGVAGVLGGSKVGVLRVGLADGAGEGAQAAALEQHGGGGQFMADPLLVDHLVFLRFFRRG